jgi:hypothetical protein
VDLGHSAPERQVVVVTGLTFDRSARGPPCAIGSDSGLLLGPIYGRLAYLISSPCGPSCSRDRLRHPAAFRIESGARPLAVSDREARRWGSNLVGQLGTPEPVGMCPGGTFADGEFGPAPCARTPAAVAIPGIAEVLSVSVGPLHGCAVRSDGAAFCWGDGLGGELGNNARLNSAVPVRVAEPIPVSAGSAPE